ncbi:MAG: hypothetical protein INQ03_14750 [Candidatus Heimdallarchaeota archaeon]|nr:hypothetical protein [Candidatus Heimdallarchaeota archaeon]
MGKLEFLAGFNIGRVIVGLRDNNLDNTTLQKHIDDWIRFHKDPEFYSGLKIGLARDDLPEPIENIEMWIEYLNY